MDEKSTRKDGRFSPQVIIETGAKERGQYHDEHFPASKTNAESKMRDCDPIEKLTIRHQVIHQTRR
jgi:hypothetical protein